MFLDWFMRVGFFIIALMMSLWVGVVSTASAEEPVPEAAVRAAYLYNFALFTHWPTENETTVDICSLGEDATTAAMVRLEGKKVRNRGVKVTIAVSGKKLENCDLLYLAQHNSELLPVNLANSAILTVADDGQDPNAVIHLAISQERVVFDVNLAAARAKGLEISSRLLNLARRVY